MPFESAFFGELRDMLEKVAGRMPKAMFPGWWQRDMELKDWSREFKKNVLEKQAPPVGKEEPKDLGGKALAPPKYGAGEGEEDEAEKDLSKEAYYIPPLWGERIFSRSLNRYSPQQAQQVQEEMPRKRKGRAGKVITAPSSADAGLAEKISSIVKRALGEAPPPALPTAFEASPQGLPADEAGIFPNATPKVPKAGAAKTAAEFSGKTRSSRPTGLDPKTIQGIQEGARGFRHGTQRMLDWVKGLQKGATSTMGKEGADAPYWNRKRPYILSDSEKRHLGLLPPIGTAAEAGKDIPAKVAPIWREMGHPFAKGGALDTNPYGMPQDQGVSGAMMPRSATGLPIRGAKTDSAFGMKDNSYGVTSVGGPPSTARNY